MPLTAVREECNARDLHHTRRLRAKASYVVEGFASVESVRKRVYLDDTRILRLVMLARFPYLQ